jgi:hypothetical protein
VSYIEGLNFTEPTFVLVVLVVAATKLIVRNSPSRMRYASLLRKPSTLKLWRISNALNSRF